MSRIRILSEQLANQIAAGEVIERPASVVKELLENSIDAGAGRIDVEVHGNGTRLIRVADDGEGMDADDALLCLERHATSKIQTAPGQTRLPEIGTLGFRGEAVPSIASVARLTITTRQREAPLGTLLEIRYGKVTKAHETGCATGTVMEVRDLFGNLPARKKFLKTARTELSHIEETVRNAAVINPDLGLIYRVNNRTALTLPAGTDSSFDRVQKIYSGFDGRLLPLTPAPGTPAQISLSGYLLAPEQAGGARLRLFVNHRPVKDRLLYHAVHEGLAGFLMKGRRPAGILLLELPAGEVDVNVHPTKQEIRFRAPDTIHRLVAAAVRQAMARHQEELKSALFSPKDKPAPAASAPDMRRFETVRAQPVDLPWPAGKHHPAGLHVAEPPADSRSAASTTGKPAAGGDTLPAAEPQAPAHLVPVGQIFDLYILCQHISGAGNALVIIDQHAVHERLLFEDLKTQLAAGTLAGQTLLFPELLELEPDQAEAVGRLQKELDKLGVQLEEFGPTSYLIKSVPALLGALPPEETVTSLLAQLGPPAAENGGGRRNLDEVLATMACKAAVKAGYSLSPQEIASLLSDMEKGAVFSHCPHGRPTMKSITEAEIRKWFHRT